MLRWLQIPVSFQVYFTKVRMDATGYMWHLLEAGHEHWVEQSADGTVPGSVLPPGVSSQQQTSARLSLPPWGNGLIADYHISIMNHQWLGRLAFVLKSDQVLPRHITSNNMHSNLCLVITSIRIIHHSNMSPTMWGHCTLCCHSVVSLHWHVRQGSA